MFTLLSTCVLVGLDWAKPMLFLLLHITCSCIFMHTSFTFYILNCFGTFMIFSSLPPPSLVYVSSSWHLNVSLFCPGTLFVLGHPLLLILLPHTSGFVMRRPKHTSLRTSLDEAFIRNAKSFCQTSTTLTYPLSFTVRGGSHCVMSQSLVHPC